MAKAFGKTRTSRYFSQSNFQVAPFEVDDHPTFSEIKKPFLKEILVRRAIQPYEIKGKGNMIAHHHPVWCSEQIQESIPRF